MYKRLTLSLVLMGLAAFALTAGAFAWFSDSGSAQVTITAGSPNLTFEVRSGCTGNWDGPWEFDEPADFDRWQNIVPGDETVDCYRINNVGDGDLTVFVKHSNFSGSRAFMNALGFRYEKRNSDGSYSPLCANSDSFAGANDHRFTNANGGRGCQIGEIPEGGSLIIRATGKFVDNNANQNSLRNAEFGFLSTITGYTG